MKAAPAPEAVAAPKTAAPAVAFNLTGHALTATGLEFARTMFEAQLMAFERGDYKN